MFLSRQIPYRTQIAALAKYEDSAPIKKLRFVEYYHKARDEGLTRQNILSGWRAAGISPWDPRKVIRSSQLAINNQISQITPKSSPQRTPTASEQILHTPQNKRNFLKAVQMISIQESIPRPVRWLLSKTGKAFDNLHHLHSQDSLQLQGQQKKIDELANKRQKKVAIDCNQVFANITKIKEAQDEASRLKENWEQRDRALEARRTANMMLANEMARFQHQFHVLDRS
jgi:hypothetical protein